MVMQYFNQMKDRRRSQAAPTPKPILTEDDEAYLCKVVSQQEQNLEAPENPNAMDSERVQQPARKDSTQDIAPPASPVEEFGKELGEQGRRASQLESLQSTPETIKQQATAEPEKKKKRWSSMFWRSCTSDGEDSQKDQKDMTDILERLNLAADNNRVFSVSDETQELLRKFKLIFKDLVNGVPTAYHDLEMLLTNGNRQLQDTYTKLPSFMQKLIEKLPEKWTETLAPEMLAVASERASSSGINMEQVGKAAAAAEKMGINVPSLKELVTKPAAIVGMLRSIMAFLRARFPAVLGMNVLWSLALFILLFVMWYCHKRGREVRLENERLVTEEEIKKMNEEFAEGKIRPTETLTTTAPQGASSEEIREGVKNVERARASSALDAAATEASSSTDFPVNGSTAANPEDTAAAELPLPSGNNENARPPTLPSRTKSRLSFFGRTKTEPQSTNGISPYPGT
ncbi:hypothetical protein N7468_004635 [Penicillium chermesinum]|uniref:Uncharacterized protein n=1 Tax=Penicillium chermesinum TaxID=63820 RepID=A0A9W9P8N7_9EURO|nr:uncharacterized protein N7468_004635 [Penicillium chermesinum]KAJ5240016.1 hypothetical protein N7468_004635 [Penicillium chermesinum]